MALFNRGNSPIGIDLGTSRIKAAQVRRVGEELRMVAGASFSRGEQAGDPSAPADPARIAEVLRRRGFTGRLVTLAAPRSAVISGILDAPPRSSGAPVDQIARAELARMHRREPASFEMACWDLPASARQSTTSGVMACACPHDDLAPLLDRFEEAGLEVVAVDLESLTLARACAGLCSGQGRVTALLDIGWSSSMIVLRHEGCVVYDRVLEGCGLARVHADLCTEMGATSEVADYILTDVGLTGKPDERVRAPSEPVQRAITARLASLAEDLRASLNYARHRYRGDGQDEVLLLGGGAAMPGLADWIAKECALPVRVVTPALLAGSGAGLERASADPGLVTALGLAARFDG